MKIGNSIGGVPLPQDSASSPSSTKAGGSAKPAASADVSLSNISSTLHALESRLAKDQGFDAGKVEDIKQAIRSGDFKVNADVVADRLISSVRDMLGGSKH